MFFQVIFLKTTNTLNFHIRGDLAVLRGVCPRQITIGSKIRKFVIFCFTFTLEYDFMNKSTKAVTLNCNYYFFYVQHHLVYRRLSV